MEDWQKEYLEIKNTFDNSLLKELRDYNPMLPFKVRRVLYKCLKHGHYKWAQAIRDKYPQHVEYQSDIAVAFGMALNASKK